MDEMKEKMYMNALVGDRFQKLTKEERRKVLTELLKERSARQLAKELNIPHSTLHDWVSERQSNIGSQAHFSLSSIYKKLSDMTPKDISDWGRLEQIKEVCEELLRGKA